MAASIESVLNQQSAFAKTIEDLENTLSALKNAEKASKGGIHINGGGSLINPFGPGAPSSRSYGEWGGGSTSMPSSGPGSGLGGSDPAQIQLPDGTTVPIGSVSVQFPDGSTVPLSLLDPGYYDNGSGSSNSGGDNSSSGGDNSSSGSGNAGAGGSGNTAGGDVGNAGGGDVSGAGDASSGGDQSSDDSGGDDGGDGSDGGGGGGSGGSADGGTGGTNMGGGVDWARIARSIDEQGGGFFLGGISSGSIASASNASSTSNVSGDSGGGSSSGGLPSISIIPDITVNFPQDVLPAPSLSELMPTIPTSVIAADSIFNNEVTSGSSSPTVNTAANVPQAKTLSTVYVTPGSDSETTDFTRPDQELPAPDPYSVKTYDPSAMTPQLQGQNNYQQYLANLNASANTVSNSIFMNGMVKPAAAGGLLAVGAPIIGAAAEWALGLLPESAAAAAKAGLITYGAADGASSLYNGFTQRDPDQLIRGIADLAGFGSYFAPSAATSGYSATPWVQQMESELSSTLAGEIGGGSLGTGGGGVEIPNSLIVNGVPDTEVVPGETTTPPVNVPPPQPSVVAAMNSPSVQYMVQATDSIDCSEIAWKLQSAGDGTGNILEVTPAQSGDLNVLENGSVEGGQYYHQVYTDGNYVYDPRWSSEPVPLNSWQQSIQQLNPNGVQFSNTPKGLQ